MSKDNRANLKADHGAHNHAQAGKSSMSDLLAAPLFAIVMIGAVEAVSFQSAQAGTKYLASDTNSSYDDLTTNCSGAKPSPQSLAIFVPKTCLTNYQQVTTGTDKSITSNNRYTYEAGNSDVSYDGISELNKTPLWGNKLRRLNTIVNILSLPFCLKHPHATTTNCSGGYHA